jgi:hypothetical protein
MENQIQEEDFEKLKLLALKKLKNKLEVPIKTYNVRPRPEFTKEKYFQMKDDLSKIKKKKKKKPKKKKEIDEKSKNKETFTHPDKLPKVYFIGRAIERGFDNKLKKKYSDKIFSKIDENVTENDCWIYKKSNGLCKIQIEKEDFERLKTKILWYNKKAKIPENRLVNLKLKLSL